LKSSDAGLFCYPLTIVEHIAQVSIKIRLLFAALADCHKHSLGNKHAEVFPVILNGGEPFPSGDRYPDSHPHCRCELEVVELKK
jgi:hypothetical protein